MSWLDLLLINSTGIADVAVNGTVLPQRPTINIIGATSVVDNPTHNRTDATLTAAMPDATDAAKGAVQLAGDLAGTAAAPAVASVGGLTAAAVATGAATLEFALNGDLGAVDLASLPGSFDPPKVMEAAGTIRHVRLERRTAGTSGTTRIDVKINGVSVFAADADKPQVAFGAGNNATSVADPTASAAYVAGDRVEALLDTVEGGAPHDLRATVLSV